MDIKNLRKDIESVNWPGFMVWKLTDDSSWFIAKQYLDYINNEFVIKYIDSLDEVLPENSLFSPQKEILIYKVDEFKEKVNPDSRLLIVCKKLKANDSLPIITFPSLQGWQFIDYLKTIVPGVNPDDLEWLLTQYKFTYGRDSWIRYFRFYNDMLKISIFDKEDQQRIFNYLYNSGEYKTISNLTIFDLSNAIMHKDTKLALEVLKVFPYIDSKPDIWLLSILLGNFKRVIDIQMNPTLSAEEVGMSSKQYYTIKKNLVGIYTNSELIDIYEMLTQIEYQYKFKELPVKSVIDYLLCKILGV